MSRCRLVTRATLTPAPELELVAGDGRPDRHADQLRLDAVRCQRLLQRGAAPLDLGHVDGLLAGLLEQADRRQHPLAELLAVDRQRTLVGGRLGRALAALGSAVATGDRRAVQLVDVVGAVVQRRCQRVADHTGAAPADRPVVTAPRLLRTTAGSRSLLSVDRSDSARLVAWPSGLATAPTPRPVCIAIVRSDVCVIRSAPADAERQHHDHRAGHGDQRRDRFDQQRAEPAAGLAEPVEIGERLGIADDVQQPERRRRRPAPIRARAAAGSTSGPCGRTPPRRRRARSAAGTGRARRTSRRRSRSRCRAGRPRSKYIARPSTTPIPIRTTPTRSCSVPGDGVTQLGLGVASRRRVRGRRQVARATARRRRDDDDFDLGAARRRSDSGRAELWARDFFDGPHVFMVSPTVPTPPGRGRASLRPLHAAPAIRSPSRRARSSGAAGCAR